MTADRQVGGLVFWLPEQAADGVRSFLDFDVYGLGAESGVRFRGRTDHAVADMFLHEAQTDRVQGLGDGRDLGQDVDAVLVFLDWGRA
jgi:hypothetical protein